MPTYGYKCEKCGYEFEEFQNITAPAIEKCSQCDGEVKRVIGKGMQVIFKGSGFYATDNKKSASTGGTCCGRTQRCDKPPCSDTENCKR